MKKQLSEEQEQAVLDSQKINIVKKAYQANGLGGLSPFAEKGIIDGEERPIYLADMLVSSKGEQTYADAFEKVIEESITKDPHVIAAALINIKKDMEFFSSGASREFLADSLTGNNGETQKYLVDGISVDGLAVDDIIPTLIIMAFTTYMNSSIPELVGILPINRYKSALYSIRTVVDNASGELELGDDINTLTIGKTFASKMRYRTFTYDPADSVAGTATYSMKIYHVSTAAVADTAEVAYNKTKVVFYRKNTWIHDYEVAEGTVSCKPTAMINGKKVELEITYADGDIKVKVDDGALEDGDRILVTTEVDIHKNNIEETRGMLAPEVKVHKYVTHRTTIGVEAFKFDIDVFRASADIDIVDMIRGNFLLPKIIEEIQQTHLLIPASLAVIWKDRVDLTTIKYDETTNVYKHVVAKIATIANHQGVKTGFTSDVFLVGGSDLEEMMKMSDSTPRKAPLSGVKPLGYFGNLYHAYYSPSHDTLFPRVDVDGRVNIDTSKNVYSQLLVFGTSNKEEEKIMFGGFPEDGLRSESVPSAKNGTKWKAIEGDFVSEANTLDATHYMAHILLIKNDW